MLVGNVFGRICRIATALSLSVTVALGVAQAQIAGENVNVVTGNVFPGGDPFLQRQNEPSIAVSSANPQHLVAGANDYRTVDLPDPRTPGMTGDAWLGLYKSLDGGQTWRSTLLPGYPQDVTTCAAPTTVSTDVVAATKCARRRAQLEGKLAQRANAAAAAKGLLVAADTCDAGGAPAPAPNPACGMQAAADPVVRAGTDGLVYYAGLLFQRDHTKSKIVVARFLDADDRENVDPRLADDATKIADPIRYVDTVEVASGALSADGTTKLFVDKPWIAVDVPRGGGQTCTLAAGPNDVRAIPAGAIYVGYSLITEDVATGADLSSDVMVRASLDCGATWSAPVKLNGASPKNQGVVLAVDPITGKVYAAWRRIASGTEPDAIMVSRTFSRGLRFTAPRVVATVPAGQIFDHDTAGSYSGFRSRALPTLAISTPPDASNRWLHVAWAQRDASGWSRIVMSTAAVSPPPSSGLEADETDATADHWGAPAAVDDAPLTDMAVNFTRGHQFMPQLTASQGRIVLVYYDSRFDHAQGFFKPNADASGRFVPDLLGRFYEETKAPRTGPVGFSATSQAYDDPLAIFNRYLDDAGDLDSGTRLLYTRHTVDVRVAMATAAATPVFSTVQASRYPVGFRGDEALRVDANGTYQVKGFAPDPASPDGTPMVVDAGPVVVDAYRLKLLRELQANPPNLPLFVGGTRPFIGDYIDVTGPAFVRQSDRWVFNTAATSSPVFHAIWTSNQDVRPPPARPDAPGDPGYDAANPDPTPKVHWTDYTPVKVDCVTDATTGATTCASKFDPGANAPQCQVGLEGSRNQNVYTSRITAGLLVSTPQNAKPLAADRVRTFVVFAQNSTRADLPVRFSLAAATGVLASFQAKPGELPTVTAVDAVVPAGSHVFRTVFAKLADPAASPVSQIDVRVDQLAPTTSCTVGDGTCGLLAGGASGYVTLNPPGAPTALQLAAGSTVNVSDQELYDPLLVDASLALANLHIDDPTNANLHIGDLAGTGLSNADPGNANLHIADPTNANLHIDTLDGANLHIADLDNANLHIDGLDAANLHIDDLGAANLHIDGLSDANLHIDNLGDGAQVSDLTTWVRNAGNTSVGYDVRVVGEKPVDAAGNPIPLQLFVTKVYTTPTAFACQLRERVHSEVETNVPDVTPDILPPDAPIPATDLDPRATHATMVLAPGQVAQVTLRGAVSLTRMAEIGRTTSLVSLPQGNPLAVVADPSTCPPTGCTLGNAVATRRASATTLDYGVGSTPTGTAAGLTAKVSDPAALGTPTGLFTFVAVYASGAQQQLAIVPVDATGTAFVPFDTMVGVTVTAYYGGDALYQPSSATWPVVAQTWTGRRTYGTAGVQDHAGPIGVDSSGNVFATTWNDTTTTIVKYDSTGTQLWSQALLYGGWPVDALVVLPSGDVMYTVRNSLGQYTPFLGFVPGDGRPNGGAAYASPFTALAVDAQRQRIYAGVRPAGQTTDQVQVFDLSGRYLSTLAPVPTTFGFTVDSILVLHNGNVLVGGAQQLTAGVSNAGLAFFDTNGAYISSTGLNVISGNPTTRHVKLAEDALGRIFVSGDDGGTGNFLEFVNNGATSPTTVSLSMAGAPAALVGLPGATGGVIAVGTTITTGGASLVRLDPVSVSTQVGLQLTWSAALPSTTSASGAALSPLGSLFAAGEAPDAPAPATTTDLFVTRVDPATGLEY